MLYFVYAYSMTVAADEEIWPQRIAHRIVSYWDDALEATWEVTRLINEDTTDPDECFAVGAIPTGATHEHNLV